MRVVSIPIDWNPSLSIFASENFLQSVGDEYGWLGGIDSTGAVVCFLPYTILYKGPFRLVRFRVETIYTDKFNIQNISRWSCCRSVRYVYY